MRVVPSAQDLPKCIIRWSLRKAAGETDDGNLRIAEAMACRTAQLSINRYVEAITDRNAPFVRRADRGCKQSCGVAGDWPNADLGAAGAR